MNVLMYSGTNSYLFYGVKWYKAEQSRKEAMEIEIDDIPGNQILNTSVEDLCGYFEEKFRFEVPELHVSQASVNYDEVQIDISQDPMRDIFDRTRPMYVSGTCVELIVPFSGDSELLEIQPTSYSSVIPRAKVQCNELVINVKGADLVPQEVRDELNDRLQSIKNHIQWLREDADEFNNSIRPFAEERINWRRNKLLADQNLVESLGFPLKVRDSASSSSEASNVQKRVIPTLPPASLEPYSPEPALDLENYDHILTVITNMALVMERSPSAFKEVKEELLRSHFLVQLNSHYEGNATGETFNCNGKTDILIRVNGKNIFIAECKIWRGKKKFSETIDQLLGYLSWRDTKSAILVFCQNKNFSDVIDKISSTVKEHPNYKRTLSHSGKNSMRYIFKQSDDDNRELILSVLPFNIPGGN